MKTKLILTIIALIAVVLFFRLAVGNADSENHGHEHGESCTTSLHDQEHEGNEQIIELTSEEIDEIGLKTAIASGGTIDIHINLTGEIRINADSMAHIVPRVTGVVTQVNKKLGDTVRNGESIAVIESQELADAKALYLSSVERYEMAKWTFEREEKLWQEKITSEQDYLDGKRLLIEAGIEKRSAQQKLLAIGFDQSYLDKLPSEPEQFLTRFEIKAPFDGTVIEKHIVLGELISTEEAVFIIADLDSVWVDLHVYPKDVKNIKKGQQVIISADSEIPQSFGVISYIGNTIGTDSRRLLARVVLNNGSGMLRPGIFINAKVSVPQSEADIVVPKESIQSLDGKKCIFIKDEHGFEPLFVETGLENTEYTQILSGLQAGQEYVTKGAFSLKSKIITSTLDSHAGHGH